MYATVEGAGKRLARYAIRPIGRGDIQGLRNVTFSRPQPLFAGNQVAYRSNSSIASIGNSVDAEHQGVSALVGLTAALTE